MIQVRAGTPREGAEGYIRRTAHIESAAGLDDIWFMTPADTHPLADDWLLAVGAAVGMTLREDVHVVGRVSERLMGSMEEIQRVTVLRHPRIRPVRITADEVAPTPRATDPRVVSCFSAGVDAFYTALEGSEQIDELLYVHGLEAFPHEERILSYILPSVRAAAVELGKPLRLAETNWRHVLEPLTINDYYISMPMIFAVAHLMGSDVTRLLVPQTYDPLFPLEHPSSIASLVGLWGTEGLDLVEYGHVPRLDKVRRLIESDIAMRHMRVCWNQKDPVYNCGHCTKCFRTRVHLRLVGADGRCETLRPLALDEIRRARTERPIHLHYIDESIAEAESQGLTDLADALRVQRQNEPQPPTGWRRQLARFGRFFRNQYRSVWRRCGDLRVRRLKWRSGKDHVFNCIGTESTKRGT